MTLPPATAPASRPWKTCLILLGLTLFAGIIRFYSIGRPCLWGDEVMTYARASGDYRDLLDVLKDDGFVPLHYTLYWAIISICKLGSHGRLIVRLVPTLLAAAAVALPLLLLAFRRRWTWATAGTVAIAAVVYALMLPLSRITVPTPLVMRFVPALAGTLAVPAMYFLAVQIVRRSAALLAAALTACSGYLMVYSRDAKMYMHFWLFCIVSVACLLWWLRRGTRLAWLAWLAAGVAAAGLHAIYLMLLPVQLIVVLTIGSWRWPRLALFALGCVVISAGPIGYYAGFNHWLQNIDDKGWNSSGLQWIDPLNAHRTGPELCLDTSTAYLTGWEWPPLAWRPDIAPAALSAMLGLTTAIFALLALGLFPWRRAFPPLRGRAGAGAVLTDTSPQSWPRQLLWLGAWIILPAYAVYCRSMRNFASPGSWKQTLGLAFAAPAWRILAILLLLLWIGAIMRRSRLFRRALISGSLIAAIVVVVRHRPFWQFWPELGQWCGRANDWGLLGAALLASAWGSWRACGENFPHRFAKTAALAVVVLAILLVCSGTYCVLHRLWQSQVSRMLADHAKVPGWDATVLQSQKQLRQERAIPGTQRADPVLRADAERITAETLAWKSVWQPRYLGVIWPALAIAASVLLLRLPTRPLRWAAIVFVLAINLGQASARIFADTEPPRDLIAQDLIDSQARPDGSASRTRAYIGVRYRTGAPGALDLYGPPGAYYIWLTEGRLMAWDDFDADKEALSRRGIQVWDYSQPFRVAADVLANPQLSRIIVWEPLDPHARATDELPKRAQALLNLLGPRWKLVDQREYPIRLHWSWNRLYLCGRLVLAKQP